MIEIIGDKQSRQAWRDTCDDAIRVSKLLVRIIKMEGKRDPKVAWEFANELRQMDEPLPEYLIKEILEDLR